MATTATAEFGKGPGFWTDPVAFLNGAWGFWDETWADFRGGYQDEDAARQGLRDYCARLDGYRGILYQS